MANLDDAHLQGANLYKAKLQGANLNKTSLQGTNLRFAQLQGTTLKNTQLQGSYLTEASFQGARFEETQLQGADLVKAHLEATSHSDTRLQGANLQEASLLGADLQNVKFLCANINKTIFQSTRAERCDFRGANFQETTFETCLLHNINLEPLDDDTWKYTLREVLGTAPNHTSAFVEGNIRFIHSIYSNSRPTPNPKNTCYEEDRTPTAWGWNNPVCDSSFEEAFAQSRGRILSGVACGQPAATQQIQETLLSPKEPMAVLAAFLNTTCPDGQSVDGRLIDAVRARLESLRCEDGMPAAGP